MTEYSFDSSFLTEKEWQFVNLNILNSNCWLQEEFLLYYMDSITIRNNINYYINNICIPEHVERTLEGMTIWLQECLIQRI